MKEGINGNKTLLYLDWKWTLLFNMSKQFDDDDVTKIDHQDDIIFSYITVDLSLRTKNQIQSNIIDIYYAKSIYFDNLAYDFIA